MAKEIEDKAFALNAGQYTQPIRTKQGFIILQATQHTPGGDGSFKQVEPQVEEALFMERMQPALRQYLTELRDQAYVEIKPGVVDTGASWERNAPELQRLYPPPPKKKKKFARTRFRGKIAFDSSAADGCVQACRGSAATAAPTRPQPPTQQASNSDDQKVIKPGKPREDPLWAGSSRIAAFLAGRPAAAPDTSTQTASVATPEGRFVNPDGTVTSTGLRRPSSKDAPEQPAVGA